MYPPELNIKKNPSFRVEVEWYRILLSERTALTILMFLIWICVFLMWLFLWKKKKKDVHEMERLRMDEWWGNRTACECYKNKSGHNYFPGILESSSTYHQHGTPDKNIWYQILICFLKKKKKVNSHFPGSFWFISIEKVPERDVKQRLFSWNSTLKLEQIKNTADSLSLSHLKIKIK